MSVFYSWGRRYNSQTGQRKVNIAGVRNELTRRSLCFTTILLAWNHFLGIT